MDLLPAGSRPPLERLGARPMLQVCRALERDGDELLAAHPGLDQYPHPRLSARILITGRIEADDALRAQRALEQIAEELHFRCRLRRPVPAEVPVGQLV